MPQTTRFPSHLLSRAAIAAVTLLLAVPSAGALAQDAAEPELTWAPLVTPPPIVAPPAMSATDQVDGYSMGDPAAPVVVEVWEDFQCPFCHRFTYEVEPLIVEQYVKPGDARLVYRTLAFLGDESQWAAVAADLAAEQNMFWPFHDYLWANYGGENNGAFHLDRLLQMGEAAGLDMDAFRAGLVLDKARERFARIEADSAVDAYALGISGTPTVVVNGVRLESPDFGTIADAIDIELAKAATASTAAESGESPAPSASAAPDEGPAGDE